MSNHARRLFPVLPVRFILALWMALLALPVSGQTVTTPHVTAALIADRQAIAPGETFTAGLKLTMAPGWHTYWRNPGDAGEPTSIKWTLPEGFSAGEIAWPSPRRLPYGQLTNFGYEGTVVLPVRITAPADLRPGSAVTLLAHARWLVCANVCVPEQGDLGLSLMVAQASRPADSATAALFSAAQAALPQTISGWRFAAERHGNGYLLVATPPAGTTLPAPVGTFFNAAPYVIAPGGAQPLRLSGQTLVLQLADDTGAKPAARLAGDWVLDGGWPGGARAAAIDVAVGPPGSAISPEALARSTSATPAARRASTAMGLPLSLLLGFLGGLVLNLMPCVFPVIGLKVLGFIRHAGENRRAVVAHGLAFTGGVLVSLWALAGLLLALRAGGEQLGWGFQLQSPWFVFLLAVVMLVFALNLSGVFEIGVSASQLGGIGTQKRGAVGSFLSGLLATVVATPCSAPFLAPALGAAMTLPAGESLLLFTAIGLGLSLPYLVLSLRPSLIRALPKPGAWMESFRQALAFPLYATAAYLVWVLAGQLTEEQVLYALWGLVLIAAALWAYGRWSLRGRMATALVALALLGGGGLALGWPRPQASAHELTWEPWSPARLAELRGQNRMVYVDFTARWCATCQVNKAAVFSNHDVLRRVSEGKLVLMRADWTNHDPAITAELARFDRSAIPFTLVYRPGEAEPRVLPELLTPGAVLKEIG